MDEAELKDQLLKNASDRLARSISCLNDKRLEAVPVAPRLAIFLAAQISHLKIVLKEIEKVRLLESSHRSRFVTDSAWAAFERQEAKTLQMEKRSRIAAELEEVDLETQFAMLESGNDDDDELKRLKEELLGTVVPQTQLPNASLNEIEALKRKLDDL